MSAADVARFWSKVSKTENCWNWTGWLRLGYGQFNVGRRKFAAHRVAYELTVGPIPEGMQLDHLCRNTRCVNPAHLEPVTPVENTHRGTQPAADNARKTHCKNGHPLSGDNLQIVFNGRRRCRICHNTYGRARWAERKGALPDA